MKKIIAFDCISGDREVFYALNAIYKFLKENKDYKVIAFIDDSIDKVSLIKGDNIEYRYVKEKILQTDSPLEIRRKPNSSLILAIKEVVEGNASAVITAAASPAVVLAGYLYSKPLKPDFKPAFCPIVTSIEGNKKILLDAGANKDVTSEMLKNYAILGRIYLKTLEVSDNPRVRLLNIGQEENKGNDFMIETYNLL